MRHIGSLILLLFAARGLACAERHDLAAAHTEIAVDSDGSLRLDGEPVPLERLVEARLSDTVMIVANGSAYFDNVDRLARTVHQRGVGHVIMRAADTSVTEAVLAHLVEPEFEPVVIAYNVLHITVRADSTIHVVRGESPEVQVGTIPQIATIVRQEVALNPSLTVGLGLDPDVRFDEYLACLLLLEGSAAARSIVNAPVPGSSPSTVDWIRPESRISIVFYEPWRDLSRWQAQPSPER